MILRTNHPHDPETVIYFAFQPLPLLVCHSKTDRHPGQQIRRVTTFALRILTMDLRFHDDQSQLLHLLYPNSKLLLKTRDRRPLVFSP